MFYSILEIALIFLMTLFAATQLLVPLYYGTLLFPAFRKRNLTRQLAEAKDAIEDEELEIATELAKLQAKALRESRLNASGDKK